MRRARDMETAKMTSDEIRVFWDSRASLGDTSGSNDFILKDLETAVFLEKIKPESSIIDIGCGNGKTLITMAMKNRCKGVGVDFSEENIKLALRYKEEAGLGDEILFRVGKIPGGLLDMDFFDYALTQRCLVNLPTKEDQKKAFSEIISRVKPGGYYLMIEDSRQGLASLNALRSKLDLAPIPAPWHNLFLDEDDVATWGTDEYILKAGPDAVASTYYFLSRVIYAKIGEEQGLKPEELKYDSEINLLAYRLPRDIGDWGAPKLWIWQKSGG
jgi:SAM-dependent methyltransferase